jgi:hypothetical protein
VEFYTIVGVCNQPGPMHPSRNGFVFWDDACLPSYINVYAHCKIIGDSNHQGLPVPGSRVVACRTSVDCGSLVLAAARLSQKSLKNDLDRWWRYGRDVADGEDSTRMAPDRAADFFPLKC